MLEGRKDSKSIEERRREKLPDKSPLAMARELGTDNLTGLLNQNAFRERITKLIGESRAQREGDILPKRISFFFIDVDDFKSVNTLYGHPVGDQVLQLVGRAIRNHVERDSDFAARWAGDEFAACFKNAKLEAVREKAEDIRREVEMSRITLPDGREVKVTISIGIAETMGHRGIDLLYERAADALREAKGVNKHGEAEEEGEKRKNRIALAGPPQGPEDMEYSIAA